ncbi:peptidoglycan-binding protein [Primorskyibacter aestuariivivens]|uniref:peptidoglycan-binding protein n=1 Tax=Primorskyibacter aestuariivivens TaxID=1888912 RepID=UPI0023005ADD|nr:peptidoglycan-binding protein [Primorskyibacter aestuariivivens]MDA7430493.1 peptidoglycan-binding protein [Primorskyibacter aestuariivivens]
MSVLFSRIAIGIAALVAVSSSSPGRAADVALVLANSDYRRMPDFRTGDELRAIAEDLARNGFDVVAAFDEDTRDLLAAADRFRRLSDDADRILIVVSGHIATTTTDAWLLGTEANRPDLMSVAHEGLSLSGLARFARHAAGRSVILVGPTGKGDVLGTGLGVGTRGMDLPQGVTLARGSVENLRRAIFDGLLARGKSLDEALSHMSARGFLSKSVGFTAGRDGPRPGVIEGSAEEDGFWNAVRAIDTEASYELYISRYPRGRFVEQARDRIAALEGDRVREWAREEEQLGLNRNDRRRVQGQLTLLGYNTRGVDGIFGNGTRNAIRAWQRANGYPQTGYLTRTIMNLIASQAREVEREREEEEARADDAYWERTGARGTVEGLRAYLDRYPRGRHAAEARDRLAALEEDVREDERAEVRAAWSRAREADTIEAYRDFIERYPNTRAAESARERIRELREKGRDASIRKARSEERDILRNPITMLLVEQRLIQLGYRPGVPDGNFDDNTRNAIRKFQKDRDIFDSGYVDRKTAGFLLSGR